ncbi:MAG: DHH family phosphoesterase [Planctomycetota bacterium]
MTSGDVKRRGTEATPPEVSRLGEVLDGHDSMLVFCHMNPDPDSIASGLAMKLLLERRFGKTVTLCYRGIIGRAQNREMVRLLAPELTRFRDVECLDFNAAVLVDAQPEFGFNPDDLLELEQDVPLQVCIDHHPFVESTRAIPFHDVRPGLGATSTIMTGYLRLFSIVPTAAVATALYYGIKTDTLGLTRRTTDEDRAAYAYLAEFVDHETLERIEHPPLTRAYFRDLASAIDTARVFGPLVLTHLDEVPYPDLVAEIADLLLKVEDVHWAICVARFEKVVVVSVRTSAPDGDAGVLIRDVVGTLGTAGGHNTMAAARIPLDGDEPRVFEEVVELLRGRLLTRLGLDAADGEPLASRP